MLLLFSIAFSFFLLLYFFKKIQKKPFYKYPIFKHVPDTLLKNISNPYTEEEEEEEKEKEYDILHYNMFQKAVNLGLTGGKGSSLVVLNCIKNVLVPYFFIVTTNVYSKMVKKYKINGMIKKLEGCKNKELKVSFGIAKEIRNEFINEVKLDENLVKQIKESYGHFSKICGVKELSVAVRSSATTEDLKNASFAGLHSTFLNQIGIDNIINSIIKCWASVFSDEAVLYRIQHNISHVSANVAVIVQKMIKPKVAGTSFTLEIGTSYDGIHICSSYGLGESLVSGEVTSDEYILNKENFCLIKRVRGSKRIQYKLLEDGSGVRKVKVKEKDGEMFSLDLKIVKEIARVTKRIGEVYNILYGYKHIDTEFALSATPTLYFLQARPVVPVFWDKIICVDKNSIQKGDLIIKGKYSLMGSCHGKIKIIKDFQDLVNKRIVIEKGDIVVSYKTGNYWNQYLVDIKGIVTVEGSPTAHPMLIGRERKIPCVIGCSEAMKKLTPYDRQWVTLDGTNKCVYKGKKVLIEANSKELLTKQFETCEVTPLQTGKESLDFLTRFNNRAIEIDGEFFVFNPNCEVSTFLHEIIGSSYAKRKELICKTYDMTTEHTNEEVDEIILQIDKILNKDVRFVNNKMCEKFVCLEEYVKIFDKMTITQAEYFSQGYEEAMINFEKSCRVLEMCKSAFDDVIDKLVKLYAFMFLSFFFRTCINRKAMKMAQELKVSKYHYSMFSKQIQSRFVEVDNLFHEDLLKLSKEVILYYRRNNYRIPEDITYDNLQRNRYLFNDFVATARKYKMTKECNFKIDIPFDILIRKIKDVIAAYGEEKLKGLFFKENEMPKTPDPSKLSRMGKLFQMRRFRSTRARGRSLPDFYKSKNTEINKKKKDDNDDDDDDSKKDDEEYFIEHDEFRRWVTLSIRSRIQHCNAHHYKIRGFWKIKDLLSFIFHNIAKKDKKLQNLTEIFQLSIEEISYYLPVKKKNMMDSFRSKRKSIFRKRN